MTILVALVPGCGESDSSTGGGAGGSAAKGGASGSGGSAGAAASGGASGTTGTGGASGSAGKAGGSGSGGASGSAGNGGASGAAGASGAGGSGGVDLGEIGKPCVQGKCPAGLTPVKYCGIAGCSPEFCSCEVPCEGDAKACPPTTTCTHISDGPGNVCR